MYKNNIIVLIKKDGQPLRETDGKFVYLPFGSEYSFEIKNQSWRRAVASIKVDGTDVLGNDEIIVPAYGTVNVERFITNGDLSKGKKFKFVPLSDSKVQDPSSPENGLVEIEVWFEKQPEIKIYYTPSPIKVEPWKDSSSWTTYAGCSDNSFRGQKEYRSRSTSPKSIRTDSATMMYCSSVGATSDSFSSGQIIAQNMSAGEAGATVEGGKSSQSFTHGYFGQKDYPSVTFKFWLRGVEQEVTTEDKLYCSNCGKKTRFDYKYCPRCGAPLQIA